jgi:hypothetical protein
LESDDGDGDGDDWDKVEDGDANPIILDHPLLKPGNTRFISLLSSALHRHIEHDHFVADVAAVIDSTPPPQCDTYGVCGYQC